ncbi:MAG TPA: hypothetical protein VM286_08730 [Candidatus Thermoplasmatota archaeon]|nr:hypothetical protein [Candidatus Thermoplasmatota archaeon]
MKPLVLPAQPELEPWLDGVLGAKTYIAESEAAWLRVVAAADLDAEAVAQCVSLLQSTRLVKLTYNRVASWKVIWAFPGQPRSKVSTAGVFVLAVRDFDHPFDAGMSEWTPYLRKRKLQPNQRRSMWNQKKDPETGIVVKAGLPSGQRPRDAETMKRELRRAMALLALMGYNVTGLHFPRKTNQEQPAPNEITWLLDFAFPLGCLPEAHAFLSTHLIRMSPEHIRWIRVSWVQRYLGALAIITPWGAKIWLGPHGGSIKGQANRMKDLATEDDPDPLLFGVLAGGRWREMTHEEHLERLRIALRREDIDVMDVIRTGVADGLARNFSIEYIMQCLGQSGGKTSQRLQHMDDVVQLSILEGDFAQIEGPGTHPATPGYRCCPLCKMETLLQMRTCGSCKFEFDAEPERQTWIAAAVSIFHDVLTLRGDTPEKHAKRFHDTVLPLMKEHQSR